MKTPVRILHLEDNEDDAELIKELLLTEGIPIEVNRLVRRDEFVSALERGGFDVILCDYNLPSFDGLSALGLAKAKHPDVPFIFVSGTIGETLAIEALKHGATDYVLKDRLSRLGTAISRAIQEVEKGVERKQLEQQLLHAQKMETIGTLAGGIAHDFNNILGIILGYVSLMKSDRLEPAKHGKALETMTEAVNRGASLVRQLLAFARKSEVIYAPVNAKSVLEQVAKMCSQAFPKQISIALGVEERIPQVLADENQLHQALLNMCVNARDAMPDGGTLSLKTACVDGKSLEGAGSAAESQKYVCISISDTGTGMDKETQSRIFEPFFTTKEVGKGTGLGLAMVYGFVNSHGGLISVDSEVGKGTTFFIHLPELSGAGKVVPVDGKTQEEVAGGTETILLLEDEETILELVKTLLEGSGYRVLVARDGLEGIEVFRKHVSHVDLVLTDIGLPKLNGWEAFLRMKVMKPGIAAIVATGYIDAQLRSDMLRNGAKDFLQKPFVPNDILRKVRDTLDVLKT